ncbi:MAG: CPBP family intramembrane metalloprotease [Flavobacteriales bacterium]|nr:CPBP family intramembrane metalloprotease [Flavobacteriales bacterium]
MNRRTFFLLGLLTLIGFSSIGGLVIEQFQDVRFFSLFQKATPWYEQIGIGLLYGVITALIGWYIVNMTFLANTRTFFARLIQGLNLSVPDILFISFCAGAGEEILFRGAIQPYLGIWVTAILFVAIHGYLNPKNWRISVYGTYMCIVIAGMGYLSDYFGITTAIAAHFAIDVVLLYALIKTDIQGIGEAGDETNSEAKEEAEAE